MSPDCPLTVLLCEHLTLVLELPHGVDGGTGQGCHPGGGPHSLPQPCELVVDDGEGLVLGLRHVGQCQQDGSEAGSRVQPDQSVVA